MRNINIDSELFQEVYEILKSRTATTVALDMKDWRLFDHDLKKLDLKKLIQNSIPGSNLRKRAVYLFIESEKEERKKQDFESGEALTEKDREAKWKTFINGLYFSIENMVRGDPEVLESVINRRLEDLGIDIVFFKDFDPKGNKVNKT